MKNDNVYPLQNIESIRAEARRWVLLFDGDKEPSQGDIDALKAWANRSPTHKKELKKAQEFWVQADTLSQLAVPLPTGTPRKFTKPGTFSRTFSGSSFGRFRAIAATLLLIFVPALVAMLLLQDGSVKNGIYSTAVGELTELSLQDGSSLYLDTNSQVEISFTREQRNIQLLKGKAHFNVSHDPERPFDVHTTKGVVRAVGTAFSVALGSETVKISVDEGAVKVVRLQKENAIVPSLKTAGPSSSSPEEQLVSSISAGQSLVFDETKSSLITLTATELEKELSWKNGMLVFTGEPLSEVLKEVSRYTTADIRVNDPAINQLSIGGRFRVGELDTLLNTLEVGFGIQASRMGNQKIVLDFTHAADKEQKRH
jgi:transmembrane sensor